MRRNIYIYIKRRQGKKMEEGEEAVVNRQEEQKKKKIFGISRNYALVKAWRVILLSSSS